MIRRVPQLQKHRYLGCGLPGFQSSEEFALKKYRFLDQNDQHSCSPAVCYCFNTVVQLQVYTHFWAVMGSFWSTAKLTNPLKQNNLTKLQKPYHTQTEWGQGHCSGILMNDTHLFTNSQFLKRKCVQKHTCTHMPLVLHSSNRKWQAKEEMRAEADIPPLPETPRHTTEHIPV